MTDQTKNEGLALVVSGTPAPAAPPKPEAPVNDQLAIPADVCPLLSTILAWPRAHGTANEQLFNKWLKKKVEGLIPEGVKYVIENFENAANVMAVTLWRKDDTKSDVLFSCHVDTVDDNKIALGVRKSVVYDANFGLIFLDKESAGTCLGADDGAGVWIMMKMIAAGKPGTYLFHRGEECGGISAKMMAQNQKEWLSQFCVAAAFDRPRNNEIILSQGGMVCASDKFGKALAESLNLVQPAFEYKVSYAGVYTDTKEYRRIIHECINIGVGYQFQHGKKEELDYAHLTALLDAAIKIDWDILPVDRDASLAKDYTSYTNFTGGWKNSAGKGYQGSLPLDDFDDGDFSTGRAGPATGKPKPKAAAPADLDAENLIFDAQHSTIEELHACIEQDSDWALRLTIALLRENARFKADNRQLERLLGQ